MIQIIIEILIFALAFTFLFAWGTIKKQRQQEELIDKLTESCRKKVLKAFKTEKVWREQDLLDVIDGTKASLFWSKHKVMVNEPDKILQSILETMLDKGQIVKGKQNTYEWIKGANE